MTSHKSVQSPRAYVQVIHTWVSSRWWRDRWCRSTCCSDWQILNTRQKQLY